MNSRPASSVTALNPLSQTPHILVLSCDPNLAELRPQHIIGPSALESFMGEDDTVVSNLFHRLDPARASGDIN